MPRAFTDEAPPERNDPLAPATALAAATSKAATVQPDRTRLRPFQGLLDHLATRNTHTHGGAHRGHLRVARDPDPLARDVATTTTNALHTPAGRHRSGLYIGRDFRLEVPAPTRLATGPPSKGEPGFAKGPLKAVQMHAVHSGIDDIGQLASQADKGGGAEPTFEHRELHSHAIGLVDSSNSGKPSLASSGSRVNVISNKNVHLTRDQEGRITGEVSA